MGVSRRQFRKRDSALGGGFRESRIYCLELSHLGYRLCKYQVAGLDRCKDSLIRASPSAASNESGFSSSTQQTFGNDQSSEEAEAAGTPTGTPTWGTRHCTHCTETQ